MVKLYQAVAFAAVGLLATGCVTDGSFKKVKAQRDNALMQLEQSQAETAEARKEADIYKQQLAMVSEIDGRSIELSAKNVELQNQLDDMNAKYFEAMDLASGQKLPAELVAELNAFAAANEDLLEFDSSRRMVKFKSDFTFGKGSVELSPKGKEALVKLAKILNSQQLQPYEILVAGHTDATRVGNPATIKAGHKDNWYLSAHRAIVVGQELTKQKVAAQRMAMVGYADQRPVASNANEQGRSKNRRVEILILPTPVGGTETAKAEPTSVKAEPSKPVEPATPSTQPTAWSDEEFETESTESAWIDTRPEINK
jgi:chemotaxis protein MotB